MGRPYYILFAGVNGAGKSTLYRTGLWETGSLGPSMPRVNSDEILQDNGWDWRSESDQMKAGRIAVRRIRQHFEKHESFNQETTLTGHAIMRNIKKANETSYRIVMFYVCVDDPAIANGRIAQRGAIGGHSIAPNTVARRYDASLSNLASAIPLCDETFLFDNTVNLELEARFEFDELCYFNPSEPGYKWVSRVMGSMGYREIPF